MFQLSPSSVIPVSQIMLSAEAWCSHHVNSWTVTSAKFLNLWEVGVLIDSMVWRGTLPHFCVPWH